MEKEMLYVSTRGNVNPVSGAEAVALGMVPRGGLFVPESIPQMNLEIIKRMNYGDLAFEILKNYFSGSGKDYHEIEIREYIQAAYNGSRFDSADIAPLVKLDNATASLELWHGPTAAFKDLALQIMPHFLSGSIRKMNKTRKILILVATSGDTGKAALEGYRDIPETRIIVFYPKDGVSPVQESQMLTTPGNNTTVIGVEGNFDDCQNMVKSIFGDAVFEKEMQKAGYELSSANSINWGRLAPQIIYYFWAYFSMVREKMIGLGDSVNAVVPTGNFGNILAGFYAREMGLPLGKLICASNRNNVLSDFIQTGLYDRKRKFYKTSSPSMDILISSNLERFLFEITNHNVIKIKRWYEELSAKGSFRVDDTTRQRLTHILYGNYATEAETKAQIKNTFEQFNYLIDPHTAVGFNVLEKYRQTEHSDQSPAFICSTASPFKFSRSVYEALTGEKAVENETLIMTTLSEKTGKPVHRAVSGIDRMPVRHSRVIRKDNGREAIRETIAEG